jgi:hypothetical protein
MLPFATLHIWAKCPASAAPADNVAVDRLITDTARETMAARYVVTALSERAIVHSSELVGRVVRGGGEVTEEIAEYAQLFINDMRSGGFQNIRGDIPIANESEGVANADVWCNDTSVARMSYSWRYQNPRTDLKLKFAASVLQRSRLLIYQPRASRRFPWTDCGITQQDAHATRTAVESAALAAWAGNDCAVAGEHCSYCSHRAGCAELMRTIDSEYDRPPGSCAGGIVPAEMLGGELTHARRMVKVAEARMKALEAEVRARMASEPVIGWCIEDVKERQWAVDPCTAGFVLGVNLTKEIVLSPAQAEKAGANRNAVASLVKYTVTGTRLGETKHGSDTIQN